MIQDHNHRKQIQTTFQSNSMTELFKSLVSESPTPRVPRQRRSINTDRIPQQGSQTLDKNK